MPVFGRYDPVDVYIIDDGASSRSYMLQKDVTLNDGNIIVRLEAVLFPEDLPINRSSHIAFTAAGNDINGDQPTFKSASFFMIRTQQNVSGTMLPLPPPTASSTLPSTTLLTISKTTSTRSFTPTSTTFPAISSPQPTNGADTSEDSAPLSPLVIGLISAGCGALLIALVAIFLLLRARRRYKGNTSYFKSLDDQPGSPTEESTKGASNFKLEDDQESAAARAGEYGGPMFAGSIAAGRSSSNTARSAEPMIKGAPAMLPYYSQSPPAPSEPLPLLERKTSTLYDVPENAESAAAAAAAIAGAAATAETAVAGRQSSVEKLGPRAEPVLSANDAQLIAETFRKSMRKPRWEDTHDEDDDDDERDEARKAANALLRKELSEEGVDVQRGVQRRVTIQDRSIRTPGGSSLESHSLSIPPP
ncbi:hypothetical protein BGX24_000669 [Mortierella sp. AD032]|nr:hypothetical protein BGX24_000669 [Mortierella sp. AD032]